ncbi:hypothetical protein B0H17DRAFT_873532, partial [Mycena rosella]
QGELAHRLAKKFYAKTNKRNFERQIASQERRQRLLRAIKKRVDEHADKTAAAPPSDATITPPQAPPQAPRSRTKNALAPEDEVLPRTPPRQHHHISESKRTWLGTLEMEEEFPNDPALVDFLPKLKSHLLSQLLGVAYDGDETSYSIQDLADVNIVRERLYTHKLLRVNFTTYDVR